MPSDSFKVIHSLRQSGPIGADAGQAFHDLFEQARHLVRTQGDGVPVAIGLPGELADLCQSAADAAHVAAVIWVALDNQHAAVAVTCESAEVFQRMRRKLLTVLADPEFLLCRMKADKGRDDGLRADARASNSAMKA